MAVAAIGGGAALYMLPGRFSLFPFFVHGTYCLAGRVENGIK